MVKSSVDLCALEASGDLLSAVVQQQAQWQRDVEVDAQDISFNGGAKANSCFEVHKTLNEAAARGLWWGTDNKVYQVIQQVGTHPQLKGVLGASGLVMVVFVTLWGWWARDISRTDHNKEKEVEREEEGTGCKSLRSHFTESQNNYWMVCEIGKGLYSNFECAFDEVSLGFYRRWMCFNFLVFPLWPKTEPMWAHWKVIPTSQHNLAVQHEGQAFGTDYIWSLGVFFIVSCQLPF